MPPAKPQTTKLFTYLQRNNLQHKVCDLNACSGENKTRKKENELKWSRE